MIANPLGRLAEDLLARTLTNGSLIGRSLHTKDIFFAKKVSKSHFKLNIIGYTANTQCIIKMTLFSLFYKKYH